MAPVAHYAAYRPRPFTHAQRHDTTILFGGLTWKHERLVQGALHNLGYQAEPLPNIARADLDAGKELTDVGACCPTTFTTGSLVNFLRSHSAVHGRAATADRFLFMTAGACGPCRFGQYHESYSLALDGLGLRDFRILLLDQTQLDQGAGGGGGLDVNLAFSTGVIWALLCGDLLTDLEYATRPYEVVPGTTDRVLRAAVERLYAAFRDRPVRAASWRTVLWHLATRHFTNALRDVRRLWSEIEVDRLQVKPKVKITGEFWLQTHEGDGNYNIKRWLEQEGAEVIPPPVVVWLDYLLRYSLQEQKARAAALPPAAARAAGLGRRILGLRATRRLLRFTYDRLRRAVGGLPAPLPDQEELARLAHPFFHQRMNGGEGHMLIGKALAVHLHKKAHMVCELSPYACMPNTMSVGAMAGVLGKHPDLLYAPIEIKGDAEVHALSRCSMVLTEAKKRAQREWEETLAVLGETPESLRARAAARPDLARAAIRPIPHAGRAGTAANLALLLAGGRVRAGSAVAR